MTDFYLKSGAGAADFQQAHTYSLGDRMVPARADAGSNFAVARKWVWECTTGGLTVSSNPTWPASVTQDTTTVTDGTATFTARLPGYSSGSTANWAWATIYVDYVVTAMAAGDRLFVSKNDSESFSASVTLAFPGTLAAPSLIYSVDDSAAPPTSVVTGALWATTGASAFTVSGIIDIDSVAIKVGSTSANASLALTAAGGRSRNCSFTLAGTSATAVIYIQDVAGGSLCFEDPTFKFASVGQGLALGQAGGTVEIVGGEVDGTGSAITALFKCSINGPPEVNALGFDMSAMAAAANIISSAVTGIDINMALCKLPASWTGLPNASIPGEASRVALNMCDNGATNYVLAVSDSSGSIKQWTTNYAGGGATDGTTPLSWGLAPGANASYPTVPLKSEWVLVEWDDSPSAKTLTWDYVADAGVSSGQGAGSGFAWQNNQVWIEAMAMESSASPLGTFLSSAPASPLATPSDNAGGTKTWTTSGMTTPKTGSCTISVTTAMKGPVLARICFAAASGKTIFADPKPTLA